MNQRQKGFYRDKLIVETIADYTVLDTAQVYSLFFQRIKHGKRKAQERLLKLYRNGKVLRTKTAYSPYYYYLDEKPGMIEHRLAVNWVRIWLQQRLKSWEKMYYWGYEQDYKILRADGFVAIKNTVTGKFSFYFIELDRCTNEFDKVEKYNRLFSEHKYIGQWWADLTDVFPPVLIVTTTHKRASLIESKINEQNTEGLRFSVLLLDQIKSEVF